MLTLIPGDSLSINPQVGFFSTSKIFRSTKPGVVVQKVTKSWKLIEALEEKDKITFLSVLVGAKSAEEWQRFKCHGWGCGSWKTGSVVYYEAFQLWQSPRSKQWESLPDVFSQAAYHDLGSTDNVECWQFVGGTMLHWYDAIEIKGEAVVFSNEAYEKFNKLIAGYPKVHAAGDTLSSVYEADLFREVNKDATDILNSHFYKRVPMHTIASQWTGCGYDLQECCDGEKREDKPSAEEQKCDMRL